MRRLINADASSGDVLSDILQCDHAVLLDSRGDGLMEQIQLFGGIDRTDAARWLRECADELDNSQRPTDAGGGKTKNDDMVDYHGGNPRAEYP